MAYGTADEAELTVLWYFGKIKYFRLGLISTSLNTKKGRKLLPYTSLNSLFLVWSLDIQALHTVYMLTFVHNTDNNDNADADNHTLKGDW